MGISSQLNTELANKLGNLISRVSTLSESIGLEKATPINSKKTIKLVEKNFESLELDKALNEIFSFIDVCNEYIQEKKPWETKNKKVIYQLANAIKDFTILLSPFIPDTCEKIAKTFNFDITLKTLKSDLKVSKITKSEILFKKIELNSHIEETRVIQNNKINKSNSIPGIMTLIEFKDWEKIDLKVGKIEKVEDIEGADKLYKLTVNIGKENKIVCAGLKKHYSKEQLKNKKIILFVNLTPRKMKGVESQGMILAAISEDESQVILISPEKDIKEGSKIR